MSQDTNPKKAFLQVTLESLRPTQGAVGFLEVELKQRELQARARRPDHLQAYLTQHPVPAVRGPDGRLYLTDHHHLGLALTRLSEAWDQSDQPAAANPWRQCPVTLVHDYGDHAHLSLPAFLDKLKAHALVYPYDGKDQPITVLPRTLAALENDPWRSLAGLARKAGAWTKVPVPYTEFAWARFLRPRIAADVLTLATLPEAILTVCQLARTPEAAALPGAPVPTSAVPDLAAIQARLDLRHGADDLAPPLPS